MLALHIFITCVSYYQFITHHMHTHTLLHILLELHMRMILYTCYIVNMRVWYECHACSMHIISYTRTIMFLYEWFEGLNIGFNLSLPCCRRLLVNLSPWSYRRLIPAVRGPPRGSPRGPTRGPLGAPSGVPSGASLGAPGGPPGVPGPVTPLWSRLQGSVCRVVWCSLGPWTKQSLRRPPEDLPGTT